MEDISLEDLDAKAPRTKRDYFALSKERNAPARCPLLRHCERRSFTIKLFLDHHNLKTEPPKPVAPVVPIIDDASLGGGDNHYVVRNLCPEVALFDDDFAFPGFAGYPMTSANYDIDLKPPYRLLDTGHFTECAEYNSAQPTVQFTEIRAENDVLQILERIASSFPAVVERLARRQRSRPALTIDDEYDVQYLFQALLSVEFQDIRVEETGPSTGGGSMRADCLLKAQQTIIEFKMSRRGFDAVQLRKELADDFVVYASHPDCKKLFVFVYDRDKRIINAPGVETDLSVPRPPIQAVRTFIQQG